MDIENLKNKEHAKKVSEYRKQNPEKVREQLYKYWRKPYICECGAITTMKNKQGHRRSAKHARNLQILEALKPKNECTPISV